MLEGTPLADKKSSTGSLGTPESWSGNLLDVMTSMFCVDVQSIISGARFEVTTTSGPRIECLITETGLEVQNGDMQGSTFRGFVAGHLVAGFRGPYTPQIIDIKKI